MRKISLSPDSYYALNEHKRSLMIHESRVKNIKTTFKGFSRSSNRMSVPVKKKPLAQFHRLNAIEMENKALLQKLTDNKPSSISHLKHHKLTKNNLQKAYEEQQRRSQNEGLCKRIKEVKSIYSNTHFFEERKKTERILKSKQEYRKRLEIKRKSLQSKQTKRRSEYEYDKILKRNSSHHFKHHHIKRQSAPQVLGENGHIVQIFERQEFKLKKGHKKVKAYVKGVQWSNQISLQVEMKKNLGNVYKISLKSEEFKQIFSKKLQNILEKIEYDEQNDELWLN